jgi:hypothetical protein
MMSARLRPSSPRSVAEPQPSGGASLAEAREALAFWSARASRLPWHRRGARREAQLMVARSRARLIGAQLERRGLGPLALALAPLLQTLARSRKAHLRGLLLLFLRRTPQGRALLVGAAAVVAASLAGLALLAALASQLLPL